MSSSNKISKAEVLHMANLSRLKVSEQEQEMFVRQFGQILNYMETLQNVDVKAVEPLYSPASHSTKARSDEVHPASNRTKILQNAPGSDEQYFIVPRIV